MTHEVSLEGPDLKLPADARQKARFLLDVWVGIGARKGALPARTDIDVFDLVPALGNVWLIDVDQPRRTLIYRLVGSNLYEAMGADFTGRKLEEIAFTGSASAGFRRLWRCVETGRASYYRGPTLLNANPEFPMVESLVLPLSQDGRTINMLMGATVFFGGPWGER